MPFFEFSQNNSGGIYEIDRRAGISTYVIIEANSSEEANLRAGLIGLYFGGEGDCPCCGDRWYPLWDDDKGTPTPERYGNPVVRLKDGEPLDADIGAPLIYVHYLNGRVKPGKVL